MSPSIHLDFYVKASAPIPQEQALTLDIQDARDPQRTVFWAARDARSCSQGAGCASDTYQTSPDYDVNGNFFGYRTRFTAGTYDEAYLDHRFTLGTHTVAESNKLDLLWED